MKKLVIAMFMIACALSSQATISLNLGGGQFQDHEGNALFSWDFVGPINQGQLFMLIADVDGDGFESLDAIYNNTGFLAGDDVLVGSWGANFEATYADGELSHSINGFNTIANGVNTGDAFALIWFEDVMASSVDVLTDTAGINQYYGYHTEWTSPADPGTYNLNHTFTGTDGLASYQTIPEPATALLALIGGGMAYALRRKQNILA